ncbi:ATP-dependent RecD-like DNA helicase [Pelotomaculum sp. PtaB.Bin117]|uniref:SF1B family DNA helicase RecD2 n=1 Tax=Pelotomaculum sp. PtaB.Bin117 TaxID=1811694 RepID=UPI0009D5A275|nr:MAG: ATP-dependent RecD-like DNA helicase [Pelotomaculum sp. PtaB.Bin117]
MGVVDGMMTIYGFLERIVYLNEDTQFIVARLQEKGKKELTTVVGNLAGINPGESLKLTGQWEHNKKFGEQFKVEKFETIVPATVNGIEKYLGSGLIKGIGPVMARRIVRVFGLDTLDVIEGAPDKLTEVNGIGLKRVAMITKAWEEQKEIKEIMVFLQGHGVSATYSAKIFKKYGSASIETVKSNPYRLASDIYGIGFITADRIARSMGIDPNSIMRAEAGVIYVLNELMADGHVYYPFGPLSNKVVEMLQVSKNVVINAMAKLIEERRLVAEEPSEQNRDVKDDHNAVYLPPLYTAEAGLAKRLLLLKSEPSAIRSINPEKAIAWVEAQLNIQLADKQKEAVISSTRSKISIITGGPGTGKTTIIRAIIKIFQAMRLKVLLAAPTGRAAKRMQEATGNEARTIHRLLEYSPHQGGFQKNQELPLAADVVVVDESSMIDTVLMYHLVKAIPAHAVFILVGDINQLPSVGPGSVLRDMIDSGEFQVTVLDEIFRQARESRIIVNAHMINQGKFPDIRRPQAGDKTDFYFVSEDDPEKALQKILALCGEHVPKSFGYHPVKDIQVLTPMHRGELGVANLNVKLQELLNPNESKTIKGYKTFKVNDKVMQMTNNYDKEVFNGDMGRVVSIDQEEQEIQVDFDGRVVVYEFAEIDELVAAYAISIHKSQGSEYPAVIIPVMTQHYMLLQRNLIYTGITRGKELVIIVGSKKALAIAVRNNKPQKRYTRLRERLL